MNTRHFKTLRIACALILAGLVSGQVMAQQSATASADTQAVITDIISLQVLSHLNFGLLASAENGAVTMTANEGIRGGANANLAVGDGASEESRASFEVAGEAFLTYTISGGTGTINLTRVQGGAPLVVTLTGVWVPSAGNDGAIATAGTLPEEGRETLGVGGSLALLANTPSGTYNNVGGIALTVDYN